MLFRSLAVVAPFATSPTTITGIGFIRRKESDRIGDLLAELAACGGIGEELADGMTISPAALHGASIATHHDHRLAMAFGLVGLVVPGISIEDPGVVSKSWPEFWSMTATLRDNR